MLLHEIATLDAPILQIGDSLSKGVLLLRKTKLDALPVADKNENLVGIFTKANLMDAFLLGAQLSEPIDKHYNQKPHTINYDLPFKGVENVVKNSPVGNGVVVDNLGKIRGIFSKVDMIMALFKQKEQLISQLHAIYDGMHNGAIVVDRNGNIKMINKAGLGILALNETARRNCMFSQMAPNLDLSPVFKNASNIVGAKATFNGIQTVCNISPLIEEGKVAGAIVIFQELTDLNKIASELEWTKTVYKTLMAVITTAYEGLIVFNDTGNVSLVNDAFCDIFKKSKDDILFHSAENLLDKNRITRVLKTGVPEINVIEVIENRPCIVSTTPIIRSKEIIGAVCRIVFHKLDEVREIAVKLSQMNQELDYYKKKLGNKQNNFVFNEIVTINKNMQRLKKDAEIAARTTSTVLINGESGTGKELFAQSIHNASPRRKGPFIQVNCAAVPDNLLESEFFGYAPGAFTGANKQGKQGKFNLADGGTLFLDEIGDMSLNLQSKLLRILQDKIVQPVGSIESKRVDVRIIAATNQNLQQKVEAGEFRQDLYYRLNVINFTLIPLRQRREDIIPLAHTFLEKFNLAFGTKISTISSDVKHILEDHHWPGNIRELENVIERAVNYSSSNVLELASLPYYLHEPNKAGEDQNKKDINNTVMNIVSDDSKIPLDREMIYNTLHRVNGNKSKAAKLLGVSRTWLYEMMRRYKIDG